MRLIVNPAAAGGRLGREWPELEGELRRLVASDGDVRLTRAPGHATELAAEAVRDGCRRVVVAGGDGTACEAVEGIVAAGGGELALLPLGTGNDAARTLGVPLDLADAIRVATTGPARPVDLIRVGDRLVLNAIGIGLTGDINRRAARIKVVRGIAVYLVTAAASLFSYRAPRVRLRTPENVYEGSMTILAVHNGPTTGGGFALTPRADPSDGLLDATLVPDVWLGGRVRRLVAALRGTLTAAPGTVELQAPWLELEYDVPLPVHLDGNAVELQPPSTRFEVTPAALGVAVPEG